MFKNEVINNLKTINDSTKKIDNELVNIKIAIHDLEKLGLDTKDLQKILDNVGVEIYKFKEYSHNFTKKQL